MKMMKWLFGLCLMVLVICGSCDKVYASDVGMDSETNVSDFEWEKLSDGTISVDKYIGTDEYVIIPSEVYGRTVTRVDSFAFFRCNTLKHIIIPEGVTRIGNQSFQLCDNLISVSMPSTIRTIGEYAFLDCTKLEIINFPNKLSIIGEGAFERCRNLKSVSLSNEVKSIEEKTFSGCKNLSDITLPDELTSIGNSAFYGCSQLKNINFPDGLSDIGIEAFCGCSKLEKVVLPEGMTFLKARVFEQCENLKSISIPNTIDKIGWYAFKGCKNLSTIILPNGLTNIGEETFCGCFKLESITLPEGLTSIGERAFLMCNRLTSLTIPESVTSIGDYTFGDNPNLTIYANSNSYARTYAKQNGIKFCCLNPHDWDKGVITTKPTAIKDGVKTYTCTVCKTKKTEKVAKLGLPKKGKNITDTKSNIIYKVTKSAAKNGTVEFVKVSKSTSSISIPDTVIVDGVTYKVTSVSKNIFKNNKKLKKVTIGKNVKIIGANAFYGCNNLKIVTVKSTQLKTVGKNAFKGIHVNAKIKVPKSKLKTYKKLFAKKGQKDTVEITK